MMSEISQPESYESAMEELRDILGQLEHKDTDVDKLGELVARAAVLIRFCRGRLNQAEMKVNEVIDSLADLDDDFVESAGQAAQDYGAAAPSELDEPF